MQGAAAVILLLSTLSAAALILPSAFPGHRRGRFGSQPTCCICINCKLVDRCQTYHWVESMHQQPHVTDSPDFDPNDPQIQVFIRTEEEAASLSEQSLNASDAGREHRILTTEYDVFACDAFALETGKWLRLMPDADFIPT
mmetsp:Transcript_17155/g.28742  ORF Transcript_17155/g.28742 Transcript_17155/m.28742 type:complete len:141 (+) Transcript_17155:50-472(+)